MKIPTIKMTVPVFTEREYAPTSVSVNPEQEIDVRMELIEVSLEYAAFLINQGDICIHAPTRYSYYFPIPEYIDELFEAFVGTELGRILLESLVLEIVDGVQLFSEESAVQLMKSSLNRMLDNAIESDNTTVRDWI